MAVTITYESHSLEGPGRLVRRFKARGSLTIDSVATALVLSADCPETYGFWLRQWDQKSIRDVGGGVWECEVPYGVGDVPLVTLGSLPGGSSGGSTGGGVGGGAPLSVSDTDPLGREWSWDFGQATRLRTKSISSYSGVRVARLSEVGLTVNIPAKPNGTVIGYNPETGEVAGVEVPVGTQRMELQWKLPVLTMGYIKRLKALCSPEPHVNSEAFLGHAAGEVKFVGATISWSHANGFSVRYVFDCGTNVVAQEVGNNLPPVSYNAWEVLDVTYMPFLNPDDTTGPTIKLPERYFVHRVLPTADLNILFT